MAETTPTAATLAVQDRVIVPIVVGPGIEKLGIHLSAGENGYIKVKDIQVASPFFDRVLVGDYLGRINHTDARGLKLEQVKEILQNFKGKREKYTLFFLRKKQDMVDKENVASTAPLAVSKPLAHQRGEDDLELITPPMKRLKETPTKSQAASRPAEAKTSTLALMPQTVSLLPAASVAPESPQVADEPPQASPKHFNATELQVFLENDPKKYPRNRPLVKETLARAYELHLSTQIMKNMLEKQENKPTCLVDHMEETIQRMKKESQDILAIPESLFNGQEKHILQFIKYMVETGETSVKKCTGNHPNADSLNKWFQKQRLRRRHFEEGNKEELGNAGIDALNYDIALFDRLGFSWESGFKTKSFDEYFAELAVFRQENGHARVPKLFPGGLGEWVSKMRREYENFQEGLHAASLNEERIDMLDDVGMVWKIRYGRPRKGDPRFRLRRKSDNKEQGDANAEAPTAGVKAAVANGSEEESHAKEADGSGEREASGGGSAGQVAQEATSAPYPIELEDKVTAVADL